MLTVPFMLLQVFLLALGSVWVSEWGKYPIRELSLLEDKDVKILEKYLKQITARIFESIQGHKTIDNNGKVFLILDFDGFDLHQISHPKTILVVTRLVTVYQELLLNYMEACMMINVNYVAEVLLNVLRPRPILGRSLENIEFYGTNPAKWKPQLLQRLPKKALPPWYGGSADFTPIKVYG